MDNDTMNGFIEDV